MQKYLFFFILIFFTRAFCCTTFLITKKATVDGSIFVGHTDDNELGDNRIVYIPAKDHPPKSKRPIYAQRLRYPRVVAENRALAYKIGEKKDEPVGFIDEVPHTYAYFEGIYGIMNEHQLSIGESTNSTYFYFDFDSQKRIFNIAELSHIALERCKKARDAIILMGELAEKYGYFDFGETLLVADTEEGWIFEITASPEGTGALWVAKKVPDGEVFASANQFRIREVNPNDKDMLFSSNLFSVAEKQNLWKKGSKKLDWLTLVCPGEFDHPYYSLRRVWRVFSNVNKSLNLSPYVEGPYTKAYPFSIKPEKLLSLQDAMALFRDHYQDTEFDQSKGIAAGPYGLVDRYLGDYDVTDFPNKRTNPLEGAWERPISVYYVGYYYINQIRGWLPDIIGGVCWIGFDSPFNTCYMPIYAGVKELPFSLQYGSCQKYDEKFVFWPFNITSNWISLWFNQAINDVISKQKEIEQAEFLLQKQTDEKALALYQKNPNDAQKFLTKVCTDNISEVMQKWWDLNHFLMEKYNKGFVNKPKGGQKMGYSKEWRDQVLYKNGPTSYEKK